jgi:hypothetical protein
MRMAGSAARSKQEKGRRQPDIGDLVQELIEAEQPPILRAVHLPSAAIADQRFAPIDGGVNDEFKRRQPPQPGREGQRDAERQTRVAKDVNGEGGLPTLAALLAVSDPIRLQEEISDEMLERKHKEESGETPERNGEAGLRHKRSRAREWPCYRPLVILWLNLAPQAPRVSD